MSKIHNTERNIQILNDCLNGDREAFQIFIKENEKLVHNLCHSTTWEMYQGCEYSDVFTITVLKMMENLSKRIMPFQIPYDVSLFYHEVLSEVRCELHKEYSILSMPYATKKYMAREGKDREKFLFESFNATGIDEDGIMTQSKAEISASKVLDLATTEDIVLHDMEIAEMFSYLHRLSEIQRTILEDIFFKEMSVAETARKEAMTTAMVYYHRKEALKELKRLMAA